MFGLLDHYITADVVADSQCGNLKVCLSLLLSGIVAAAARTPRKHHNSFVQRRYTIATRPPPFNGRASEGTFWGIAVGRRAGMDSTMIDHPGSASPGCSMIVEAISALRVRVN